MLLHVRWLAIICSVKAWHVRVHPHSDPRVWSNNYKYSDRHSSSAICHNRRTRWARLGSTAINSESVQGTYCSLYGYEVAPYAILSVVVLCVCLLDFVPCS